MLFGVESDALAVVSPTGSWLEVTAGYEPGTLLTSQGIIYGALHTSRFLLSRLPFGTVRLHGCCRRECRCREISQIRW